MPNHFLVKSEPFKYPFSRLVTDRRTTWDGVRNFEARNHLRAMKTGDLLLFYHSNEGKEIVGIAKVARAAYADPTADEGDWSVVDVAPVKALAEPVTLAAIREDKKLSGMLLLKRSRLSVVPVTPDEFKRVLELGKTKL
ncbi:MAG TPA: EVE domain-containing protein [Polyangiaceae bacterium]|jgi:predicted RNA-binding protein with PUA-like domain|nr:EVE domain-containing protein [Polyangiaceae bacterium]